MTESHFVISQACWHKAKAVEWPAQSPDLNLKKRFWKELKRNKKTAICAHQKVCSHDAERIILTRGMSRAQKQFEKQKGNAWNTNAVYVNGAFWTSDLLGISWKQWMNNSLNFCSDISHSWKERRQRMPSDFICALHVHYLWINFSTFSLDWVFKPFMQFIETLTLWKIQSF